MKWDETGDRRSLQGRFGLKTRKQEEELVVAEIKMFRSSLGGNKVDRNGNEGQLRFGDRTEMPIF